MKPDHQKRWKLPVRWLWLTEYNCERLHESLNNLTPEEYRLMAENPEISKSAWN